MLLQPTRKRARLLAVVGAGRLQDRDRVTFIRSVITAFVWCIAGAALGEGDLAKIADTGGLSS